MWLKRLLFVCIVLSCIQIASASSSQHLSKKDKTLNHAFARGEKLTYVISWSKIIDAGIAVMEVKNTTTADGRKAYQFVASTHSVGVLEQFFPIRDVVESLVDAHELYSFSFNLKESHGSKKRKRTIAFDHDNKTALFRLNDDPPETYSIPKGIQDALSSLYYVRSRHDFLVEKPIIVDVFDSGKTWSVEIYTLGRERIKTPAGEFDTIKVKTYPKYEGVFMNKGEIFIWITDDDKKIPVLMKSTIALGSIVATLTKIETGKEKP